MSQAPVGAVVPMSDATAALSKKLVGTTIAGRYKVQLLIGEGGMGAVFLVEHTVIRKRMALKVLSADMMRRPEMVARFEREALAAAHIDHPNVVAATDSGRTDDGAVFVVLEYIDGKSLRDRLDYGPLPPATVIHITRQVAGALLRAHGLGIVHRDLKPENIMLVQRDGDLNFVKVLDFGLAKLSVRALLEDPDKPSTSEVLTRYGAVFGTPAYMAPEQAAGGEVDGRTDLYAVGVLMYELLSGKLPFDSDDTSALLRMQVVAPVPPLRTRFPHLAVSPALEQLVMSLLAKDPGGRPESAKALMDALDGLIASEGLHYQPSQPLPKVSGNNPVLVRNDQPTRVPGAEDNGAALNTQAQNGPTEPSLDRIESAVIKAVSGQPLSAPVLPTTMDPPGGTGLPKLRAPSVVDLNLVQAEGVANPAVLTPAPPPTVGERVKEAGGQAAGWVKESGWPALRKSLLAGAQKVQKQAPIVWSQLVGLVRKCLPAKHRGVPEQTLSRLLGLALGLPLLAIVLWMIFGSSGDRPPGSIPGYASDIEMSKGVHSGAAALERLAEKYPGDSRIYRALSRAQAERKNYAGAVRALTTLAKLDPAMASDDEMARIVGAAALVPETSEAAINILESALGDRGVAMLSDVAEQTTMEPWRSRLQESLKKGSVRAVASEATVVLLDLRAARTCEEKRGLFKRALQEGDMRVVLHLRALQQTNGCGPGGQNDCWPCLRRGTALATTLESLEKRLNGPTP